MEPSPDSPPAPTAPPPRWSLYGDLTWRALSAGVRACPWFLESPLIAGWATVVFVLAGSQRRSILANLRNILPEAPLWRRLFLTWRTFYQFGCVTTDGIRFEQGEDVVSWEVRGLEHFTAVAESGQPVILCTAHMGSYDAAAAFFAGRMGRRFHAVRMPERHPHLQAMREEALRRFEDGAYHTLYNSRESVLGVELLRALQDGEWVALQADRALPGLSTFTLESHGRQWLLPRGPFVLAGAARAACLPAFIRRTGPRHYRVDFAPPLAAPDTAPRDREGAVQARAAAWVDCFLTILREDPAQWLVFERAFAS